MLIGHDFNKIRELDDKKGVPGEYYVSAAVWLTTVEVHDILIKDARMMVQLVDVRMMVHLGCKPIYHCCTLPEVVDST